MVNSSQATQINKRNFHLSEKDFEITTMHRDANRANEYIDEAVLEIIRIETLLSTLDEDSQINQINKSAGKKPVVVTLEIYQLIERAVRFSELTEGMVDITYGTLDKIYVNFDTSLLSIPEAGSVKKNIPWINYKNIVLNPADHSVFLIKAGLYINFHGIVSGYTVDCVKRKLQGLGVDAGVLKVLGNLCTWGLTPEGQPWKIRIADPHTMLNAFSEMELNNMSISTSGDYKKLLTVGGKKYSHTVDPHTGYPKQGIASVSIFSTSAELSDALVTPVLLMGITRGLHLINHMKDVGCIIIDEHQNVFTSDHITLK